MFSLRRHEHSPQGTLREVRVYPLTFSEFSDGRREPLSVLWKEYCTFGGMPELMGHGTPLEKRDHLKLLWYSICLGDIARRNQIRKRRALEAAADLLCSFVGSPANPGRISASLGTLGLSVSDDTVRSYLAALENACLFSGARRFSIRERRYFRNIRKYYISDIGLLNAGTGFREQDFHCIMENVIFNELLAEAGTSIPVS